MGGGITLDLNATGNDLFTSIESFEGSAFNDAFIGTAASENFIGGAGADVINGGAGRDSAWYISSNAGVIQTANGKAYGDDGNDRLVGNGYAYELHGGAGADRLDMMSAGIDVVVLKSIQAFQDVVVQNDGVNACIFSRADWNAGNLDSGVMLSNWGAGSNTIESFRTNNGDTFTIT